MTANPEPIMSWHRTRDGHLAARTTHEAFLSVPLPNGTLNFLNATGIDKPPAEWIHRGARSLTNAHTEVRPTLERANKNGDGSTTSPDVTALEREGPSSNDPGCVKTLRLMCLRHVIHDSRAIFGGSDEALC